MSQNEIYPKSSRQIIQASVKHRDQLLNFFNQNNRVHRHLDWFTPLDWLGRQPFLIEMADGAIQAVLCAIQENAEVAWIRAFGASTEFDIDYSWQGLLSKAIQILNKMDIKRLASLALHPWFERLLLNYGFKNHQDIVVLEWGGELPSFERSNPQVTIREIQLTDLPAVECIDQLAFPPIWQNSKEGLTKAIEQTGICTVAVIDDRIIGYQISTTMAICSHLARLAVHPDFQRQGVAFSLIYDLLSRLEIQGSWRVTVNTQSDNFASLRLYDRFNFHRTEEKIAVYELSIFEQSSS